MICETPFVQLCPSPSLPRSLAPHPRPGTVWSRLVQDCMPVWTRDRLRRAVLRLRRIGCTVPLDARQRVKWKMRLEAAAPAPTRALPARWHRRAGSIVRVTRHTGAGESGVAAAPARRLPRADAVGGQAACRLLAVQDLTSSDLLLGLRGPVHVGGGVAERACAKEGIGRQRRARRHALRAPAPLPPARRRGLCALPGPAQPQRRGSYSQPTRVGATMSLCVGPGC